MFDIASIRDKLRGMVFRRLKERCRSSFVGQHRLDVIVHGRLEDGPKYVPLATLKSTFGIAGLVLTQEETEYLTKRFADNRQRIEWKKLMAALDVAAPPDFTDPDKSFLDNLPQPYRLIVSVLDTEIIDRVWARIVERHPELDTSPADDARAAAEIDLKRSCPPALRLQNPHPPLLMLQAGGRRSAEAPPAAVASAGDRQRSVVDDVKEREVPARPAGVGDEDSGSSAHAAWAGVCNGGDGGDGGVTVLQWDRRGDMLFTAGRDGSVCLRTAGFLQDISAQISSRGVGAVHPDGEEGKGTSRTDAVTFLSRPVGTLKNHRGIPSSVWIAAVTESIYGRDGDAVRGRGSCAADGSRRDPATSSGGSPPGIARSSSIISVLEVVAVSGRARPSADRGHGSSVGGGGKIERSGAETGEKNHAGGHSGKPTSLRVICVVELPPSDAAVSCALSPGGRRLAACLRSGRIATWALPSSSPPSSSRIRHQPPLPFDRHEPDENGDHSFSPAGGGGCDTEKDDRTTRGDSSASYAAEGDEDVTAAAAATAATAAAPAPARLIRPEFIISHLPSPEEVAFAKSLQEYRRRVQAGEIKGLADPEGSGGEGEEGCTPPPRAPEMPRVAHHLGHADFLPAAVDGGGDGCDNDGCIDGGGLAIWRSNSNVWRCFRLPPPLFKEDCGTDGERREKPARAANGGGPGATDAAAADTDDGAGPGGDGAGQPRGGSDSLLSAKCDISTVPSVEWVLPSPITALTVSEEEQEHEQEGQASEGLDKDDNRVWIAGGDGLGRLGGGGGWRCCGNGAARLAPLVAIGTENGGVYLCDGLLGTTREALSRHRARVTTLSFSRKTFLVSGSADEMIQIHHIPVAARRAIGGGGGAPPPAASCAGGTPRLRCLHDARGSRIRRVACLRELPLAFAEDELGRVVAYDLPTGSMLGVLALGNAPVNAAVAASTGPGGEPSGGGGAENGGATGVQEAAGVIWAAGGDRIAAIVHEEEASALLPPAAPCGSGGSRRGSGQLGAWSAADVMWRLSPGLRAIAGEDRPLSPERVAGLFYGLEPTQRKGFDRMPASRSQQPLPPKSPPMATGRFQTHRRKTAQSFWQGATLRPTASITDSAHRHRQNRASGRGGGGGGGEDRPRESAALGSFIVADGRDDKDGRSHVFPAASTGGTATRVSGATGGYFASAGGGLRLGEVNHRRGTTLGGGKEEDEDGVVRVMGGLPWQSEIGPAARVRRYMKGMHGERAARQERLQNVTRNLLQAV